MRRLWVAALFGLLGWVSIHNGWFLFRSAGEYAERLQARAENTLRDAGHSWARVEMRGQTAHLTGLAPSLNARDEAAAIVARAAGRGGWLHGGVTRVTNDVAAPEPVEGRPLVAPTGTEAYALEARWDGRTVTLSGSVPNPDDVGDLSGYTRTLGAEPSADDLGVEAGAPDGFSWVRAARFGVTQLLKLDSGVMTIHDGALQVSGEAGSLYALQDVELAFEVLPVELAALDARMNVGVRSDDPGAACQSALDSALGADVITFYPGSATPHRASQAMLDRVAAALDSCTGVSVEIEATAGPVGDPVVNHDLALRRAQTITTALGARGADLDALAPLGRLLESDPAEPSADGASFGTGQVAFTVIG